MEWEKIAEKIGDMVLGQVKEEFREFRASVTGELNGFRIAIESMNARMAALEFQQGQFQNDLRDIRRAIDETNKRIDETNKRIDETNKRIDETRAELKLEIMKNTERIDETNKRIDETNKRIDDTNHRIDETNNRIDNLYLEISEMRGDLKVALSQKEVMDDLIVRVQRLEIKMAA
jgi:uncharacterized coiled-coil DUF342 family protein